MRTLTILISALLIGHITIAQTDNAKVEAIHHDAHGLCITTALHSGTTLYGICKMYNVELTTIMSLNNINDASDVSLGKEIVVPISAKLQQEPSENTAEVYYTVRPKETLYRIAKIYARTSIPVLKELNDITSDHIDADTPIKVGYLPKESEKIILPEVVATTPTPSESPAVIEDIIMEDGTIEMPLSELGKTDTIEREILELPTLSTSSKVLRGVALTRQTAGETDGMLVMHPKAKVDSDIIIYNPMMKKAVQARVVATLDENSYAHNISVVISPAVAKALGALDKKFWVEMSYIE